MLGIMKLEINKNKEWVQEADILCIVTLELLGQGRESWGHPNES